MPFSCASFWQGLRFAVQIYYKSAFRSMWLYTWRQQLLGAWCRVLINGCTHEAARFLTGVHAQIIGCTQGSSRRHLVLSALGHWLCTIMAAAARHMVPRSLDACLHGDSNSSPCRAALGHWLHARRQQQLGTWCRLQIIGRTHRGGSSSWHEVPLKPLPARMAAAAARQVVLS